MTFIEVLVYGEELRSGKRGDHHAGHSHVITELDKSCEVSVGGHIKRAALEDSSSRSVRGTCRWWDRKSVWEVGIRRFTSYKGRSIEWKVMLLTLRSHSAKSIRDQLRSIINRVAEPIRRKL